MCGRIVQIDGLVAYVEALDPQMPLFSGIDDVPIERYNIAPSTKVQILRGMEDGLHIDPVRWGWAPHWAKGKRPDPINARVETVLGGKFFKQLWPGHRALVPSNGWYEWVQEPGEKRKQPYFIRLKSGKPVFYAALAQVHDGLEEHEGGGFVIITANSDQGMVDIHDRRPVALSPEHAREWLDPELSPERAEELAVDCCQSTEEFEWFKVSKDVGSVKNHGAYLVDPI